MYKELVKSDNKIIFVVLGFIAALLFVFAFVDLLQIPYTGIVQLICFVAMGYGTYVLIRHKLADYAYLLIDDELIVHKKIGSNETVVVAVNVENIVSIAPYDEFKNKDKFITFNVSKRMSKHHSYVLIFNDSKNSNSTATNSLNNKNCKLIFEPTETLLNLIKEHMSNI